MLGFARDQSGQVRTKPNATVDDFALRWKPAITDDTIIPRFEARIQPTSPSKNEITCSLVLGHDMPAKYRPSMLLLGSLSLISLASAQIKIEGTLVDARGKPMAGAAMVVGQLDPLAIFHGKSKVTCVTDDWGRFVLRPRRGQSMLDLPLYCAVRSKEGALGESIVRVNHESVPFKPGHVRIQAQVVDSSNRPIPWAEVEVNTVVQTVRQEGKTYILNYEPTWNAQHRAVPHQADSKGKVLLGPFPSNCYVSYRASTMDRKFLPEQGSLLTSRDRAKTITMHRPASVSGRVQQGGKPVIGATVMLTTWAKDFRSSRETKTDNHGTYAFGAVPAGRVDIQVFPPGRGTAYLAKAHTYVQVPDGSDLVDLDFLLQKGVPVTGQVVIERSRIGIPNMPLLIDPEHGPIKIEHTDVNGHFSSAVWPGKVAAEFGWSLFSHILPSGTVTSIIEAGAGAPVIREMPSYATWPDICPLRGRVIDRAGMPVARAGVVNLSVPETVQSDDQGQFYFTHGARPHEQIAAFKEGETCSHPITVGLDSSITLCLDTKCASLRGTILDENGKPLNNATLILITKFESSLDPIGRMSSGSIRHAPRGFHNHYHAVTDAKGAYEFPVLCAADQVYAIRASCAGRATRTTPQLLLRDAEAKEVPPIQLPLADQSIEGHVLDINGRPVHGVAVQSAGDDSSAQTDEKGYFRLESVSRGNHHLTVGGLHWTIGAADAEGGQKDVVIKSSRPRIDPVSEVAVKEVGDQAPQIHVSKWLNGSGYTTAALKGRVVLVYFWNAASPYSRKLLPQIQSIYHQYSKKGLVVVGILPPGSTEKSVKSAMNTASATFPNAIDALTHQAFGSDGNPHLFLIDKKGTILANGHAIEPVVSALRTCFGH